MPAPRPAPTRGTVHSTPLALAVAVAVAAAVGALLVDLPGDRAPTTAVVAASASDDRVRLVHRGGNPLDVRDLDVRVYVDGTPLARQPPVPFFSAHGFVSGPTGPFNPATDPTWSAGETASFRVASTNRPTPAPGDRLVVVLARSNRTLARASTTVGGGGGGTGGASVAVGTAAAAAGGGRPSALEGRLADVGPTERRRRGGGQSAWTDGASTTRRRPVGVDGRGVDDAEETRRRGRTGRREGVRSGHRSVRLAPALALTRRGRARAS